MTGFRDVAYWSAYKWPSFSPGILKGKPIDDDDNNNNDKNKNDKNCNLNARLKAKMKKK